jgi:hypothetical protein
MAAFNGKWKLVAGENVEAYQTAIKTPEEAKAKLKAIVAEVKADPNAYIEELFVDPAAGVARRTVWLKGEKKRENELSFGKEHDAKTLDGRPIKVKATLDSDNKLTVIEKGADFESIVTFEVSGNEFTVTQVSGGVKATEKFVRA